MEDGAGRFGVMVLGQDHLFLGIGAAGTRAVAVVARGHPPGPHALDKYRRAHVIQRWVPGNKPLLKLKTRDHTRILVV